MSYILDALRKSETERRQGRVPDLGQQVQLIHKPKKKSIPVLVWVAIGLALNAAILVWAFWPGDAVTGVQAPASPSAETSAPVAEVKPATSVPEPATSEPEPTLTPPPATAPETRGDALANAIEIPMPAESGTSADRPADPVMESGTGDDRERPTVIVPTPRKPSAINPSGVADSDPVTERAPHLVELPLAFQKKVPDLIFNSHIYASEPSSRRVMINDNYLRTGESFSGITVERITEEGVELSMDGRRFRVGVVRNWVSPE